jgi:hypothetical protein
MSVAGGEKRGRGRYVEIFPLISVEPVIEVKDGKVILRCKFWHQYFGWRRERIRTYDELLPVISMFAMLERRGRLRVKGVVGESSRARVVVREGRLTLMFDLVGCLEYSFVFKEIGKYGRKACLVRAPSKERPWETLCKDGKFTFRT